LTEQHFPNGIPSGHPRIWWNDARLAQAKKWVTAHPFEPSDIVTVDADRADPVDNAFKYLATGKASYCTTAMKWTTVALAAIPITGQTGCNECRWYGTNAILVYDWCYPTLSSTDKAAFNKLNQMLQHWNADAWGSDQPYGNLDFAENNFFWGYFANNLLWGIASYGDNTDAETFIANAMDKRWDGVARPHFADCDPHGVPFEGTDYGHYMVNYMLFPLVTAGLLGRDMLGETGYYEGAVFNFIYNMTPALTYGSPTSQAAHFSVFPYADAQDFVADDPGVYWDMGVAQRPDVAAFMKMMATRYDGHGLAAYARRWLSLTGATVPDVYVPRAIAALDPGSEASDLATLPLDYYASGSCIAQAFARTSWTSNATALHFQLVAPASLGHEHADAGNWQIWRKGRWVALEAPGRADSGFLIPAYGGGNGTTDVSQSLAHNLVMFAGNGLASTGMGLAVLKRLETNPNYFYAATDLTSSYHSADDDGRYGNPSVGHEEREFIFVRPLETLVILDRMRSIGSDTRKGFIVHAEAAFSAAGTNSYSATNVDQVLRITTVAPAAPTYRTYSETSSTLPLPYRLEVETSGTGVQHFVHVVQARDSSGPDLTITPTESDQEFDITLSHPILGCARLVLEKGETSTGGQVGYAATCASVNLQPLTTSVEGLEVTGEGPVWSGLANSAPVISSTAVVAATVGIPYVYDVYASGWPQPTFSLTDNPAGMSIVPADGLIAWTPSQEGKFKVTVVASNGVAPDATQAFEIVVVRPGAATSTGTGSSTGGASSTGGTGGTTSTSGSSNAMPRRGKGGGCGCRAAAAGGTAPPWPMTALGLMLWLRRRRDPS
jgi:MYXO-CTERM domain-containing protein